MQVQPGARQKRERESAKKILSAWESNPARARVAPSWFDKRQCYQYTSKDVDVKFILII
jgi:hypothetical protein